MDNDTPKTYVVQPGDTMAGVAIKHRLKVNELKRLNRNAGILFTGQVLNVAPVATPKLPSVSLPSTPPPAAVAEESPIPSPPNKEHEAEFQCLYLKDRNLVIDVGSESLRKGSQARICKPIGCDSQLLRSDGFGRIVPKNRPWCSLRLEGEEGERGCPLILFHHQKDDNLSSNQMLYLDDRGHLVFAHAPDFAVGIDSMKQAKHIQTPTKEIHKLLHQQHSMEEESDLSNVQMHETAVYRNGERVKVKETEEGIVLEPTDEKTEQIIATDNSEGSIIETEVTVETIVENVIREIVNKVVGDDDVENEDDGVMVEESDINDKMVVIDDSGKVIESEVVVGSAVDVEVLDDKVDEENDVENDAILNNPALETIVGSLSDRESDGVDIESEESSEDDELTGCGLILVPIDSDLALEFEWRASVEDMVVDYWGGRSELRRSIRSPSGLTSSNTRTSQKTSQKQQSNGSVSRLWAGTKSLFSNATPSSGQLKRWVLGDPEDEADEHFQRQHHRQQQQKQHNASQQQKTKQPPVIPPPEAPPPQPKAPVILKARMSRASEILDEEMSTKLEMSLPITAQGYKWKLLFNSVQHGFSIGTFYAKVEREKRTLLVVQTLRGEVFGGFTSTDWTCQEMGIKNTRKNIYFGNGESFLYAFKKQKSATESAEENQSTSDEPDNGGFEVYPWTARNNLVMLANDEHIALGGGGGSFGLFLEDDFRSGTTGACDTYDNTPLCSEEHFEIFCFEVWGFSAI